MLASSRATLAKKAETMRHRVPIGKPHAMVRLLARITSVGIETTDLLGLERGSAGDPRSILLTARKAAAMPKAKFEELRLPVP
jgi:hypothetical protein